MRAIYRKAILLVFLITFSCQAQEAKNLEHLSLAEAEAKYLALIFSKGIPELGLFKADAENPDYWQSLQMVWYDSSRQGYFLHRLDRIEKDRALNGAYYRFQPIDSVERKQLAEAVAEKSRADRDLSVPNQNAKIYLPLKVWGFSFNQMINDSTSFESWRRMPCDRPRLGVACFRLNERKTEAGLFSRQNPRIRRIEIKGVSQEEALVHLDSLVRDLQVEPEYINWTTFAKKPLIHGYQIGDLFTLSVIFQSTYPAFRLIYTYRALGGELEIKIQNTRPDYGPHPKRKKLCAFGPGSDYACEFLDYKGLKAKRNP